MSERRNALRIAEVSVLTAVVVVFTMIVKIPTARGYLNLCDVAVLFTAFTFGPWTAMIAGGLGAAFADILSGYPQWALISLVCHGLEGLLAAKSARVHKLLAWPVSVLVVAGGYFLLGGGILTGYPTALTEVPGNIGQATVGYLLGLAVSLGVVKAYPPVQDLAW